MPESREVRIWDVWVRLFHWALAVSVLFQLVNGETGWEFYDWHRLVGEFVLALVIFRVLWGLFGSSNARLSTLIASPKAALLHLKNLLRRTSHAERGHNAAGGWAVLVLLLILAVQAITGMFIADEDEYIEGALYGSVSGDLTSLLYTIHAFNAGLIQLMVGLHILMVLVYLVYAKQNLIKPMLSGTMPWSSNASPPSVKFQPVWLGAVMLATALGAVGLLTGWF